MKNEAQPSNTILAVVNECIGSYKPDALSMQFPSNVKEKGLDALQYKALFDGLSLNQDLLNSPLAEFHLTHVDAAALDGLNAFYAANSALLFKQLKMNLFMEKPEDAKEFFNKLETLLTYLSKTSLSSLLLNDEKQGITDADIQRLLRFIETQQISLPIQLPKRYQNGEYQRQLDRLVGINQRLKNSKLLMEKSSKEALKLAKVESVRTRNTMDLRAAMKIDIELQEGIEESISVEKIRKRRHVPTDYMDLKVLRLEDLAPLIGDRDFSVFKNVASSLNIAELTKFWHKIFGNVVQLAPLEIGRSHGVHPINPILGGQKVFKNKYLNGISDTALQRLIEYKEYFQNGINLNQLPQGFILIEDPQKKNSGQRVLHFDVHAAPRETIAPELLMPAARWALNSDTVDQLIAEDKADSLYGNLWKQLNSEKEYSPKNSEIFRQYLADLMLLNEKDLNTVAALCAGKEHFDYQKLAFIFNNSSKVHNLYPVPFDEANLINIEWLKDVFPELDARKSYVALAHNMNVDAIKEHVLYKFLDKTLCAQLKAHKLTNKQLNGLLFLYDKFGMVGLQRILDIWKKTGELLGVKPDQLRSITAYIPGYEEALLDNTLQDSVTIIQSFSKAQRQWWDVLYKMHQPVEDKLANLVSSFTAFSRIIAENGLEFYDLGKKGPFFPMADNLPGTLGRMLSILNFCENQDKRAQWLVMSQLNWSSTGALRAMTDGLVDKSRPCGFVVPEMECEGDFAGPEGYNDWQKSINIKNEPRLAMAFYRYIAHQQHRLPLSFYQKEVKILETAKEDKSIPVEVIKQLYVILAKVSTGDNGRYFPNELNTAIEQWESIVKNIQGMRADMIKSIVVAKLLELPQLPALAVLAKLIELSSHVIKKIGFNLQSQALVKRMTANNENLMTLVQHYGSKVYLGMLFYKKADYSKLYFQNRDLFEEHLEVIRIIRERQFSSELLHCISAFKINSQNIMAIGDAVNKVMAAVGPEHKEFKDYVLQQAFASFKSLVNDTALNEGKLKEFLTSFIPVFKEICDDFTNKITELEQKKGVPEEVSYELSELHLLDLAFRSGSIEIEIVEKRFPTAYKAKILNVVQAAFGSNFAPNYFALLKAGKPNDSLQFQIKELFRDKSAQKAVTAILFRFSTASDKEQRALINSIAELYEELNPSASEEETFFAHLMDERLLGTTVQQYSQLLDSINQAGSSSFNYFMQAAHQFPVVEELALKAHYFLAKALPQIRNNKRGCLNELEVCDLVADLVLAANPYEINQEVNVFPEQTAAAEQLVAVINSKEDDAAKAAAITKAIAKLDPHDPIREFEAIKELEQHLIHYQTEEYNKKIIPKKKIITQAKALSGFKMLAERVGFTVKREMQTVEVDDIPETVQIKVIKNLKAEIFTHATTELNNYSKQLKSYHYAVKHILLLIEHLAQTYPAAKEMILAHSRHYMHFKNSDGAQVAQALANFRFIHNELVALDDKDIVISLCNHFAEKSTKEGRFSFKDLLAIVQGKKIKDSDFGNYPQLAQNKKTLIFKIITVLMNNNKPCSLKDIQRMVDGCSQEEAYFDAIKDLFMVAPYPTLDRVESWFQQAKKTPNVAMKTLIVEQYIAWNKKPAEREETVNGFNLDLAKKQAKQMQGLNYTDKELGAIRAEVQRVQDISTKELLQEIQNIRTQAQEGDPTQLVALMAELLYRTKGLPQEGAGKGREWGRSFEINTTQYLAIHAMLKSGGRAMSQIGTGEGKSRIMMIAIACQYALGKTTDFVTSDFALATRDYLEYQSFFKSLGAKTNIISANTPASEYRLDGINFSDAANLSLFRNKARSQGLGELVIAADPKKRCLMLDEADKTYFDTSDTRFNYSAQADPAIRDMPWIYELMVAFFSNPAHKELYYKNVQECNAQFYAYAASQRGSSQKGKAEMARLIYNPKIPKTVITRNQLEAWQSSAITALSLEFNSDFIIQPKVTIRTKEGPKIVSQAQLVGGSRASGAAKFSFGVHQCLHARLNLLKKFEKKDEKLDKKLEEKLREIGSGINFYIDSETQIVYSSTSKALIDDYDEGALLGVSGSLGSVEERKEITRLFGKGKATMAFIEVPRHHGLKRVDLPVAIAKNPTMQQQQLLASIKESLKKKQPILLVCENDKESGIIFEFLTKELPQAKDHLIQISATTPIEDELNHVNNNAGKPGMITVSTAMLGRGTDIKLAKDSSHGLKVLATYLPQGRDAMQIIGRAGRFGSEGESRFILDKPRVAAQMGTAVLPTEFYTATESYLAVLQKGEEIEKQKLRIVKNTVGDFRQGLTNKFYNNFHHPLLKTNESASLLASWRVFVDKADKGWNAYWPEIVKELAEPSPNIEVINALLKDYQELVKNEWDLLRNSLKEAINAKQIKAELAFVDQALPDMGELVLNQRVSNFLVAGGKAAFKTRIAAHYDEAYVGRAVIYNHFWHGIKAFFKNISAAWNGDSPWFPNLKAAQQGHMSWSQFFFGTWGTPLPSKEPLVSLVEPNISSSDSVMNAKLDVPGKQQPADNFNPPQQFPSVLQASARDERQQIHNDPSPKP